MGNTIECSTDLGGCPFNFGSELSDQIQNYGCLPMPLDIVNMRVKHGKTWACHSYPTKPCLGSINYLKSKNLPFKVIDPKLITENDDYLDYLK